MCRALEHRGPERSPSATSAGKPQRLRPWQMRDNVACSVVGTCLSDGDLQNVLKRVKLTSKPGLASYDLHAFFVEAMSSDTALTRAVQKLLDRRHNGILKRVGRTVCTTELRALWRHEYEAGRIPGIYWAFQTYSHIPHELHVHAFGEVHMLSHVLGRSVHADIENVDALRMRVTDLESLVRRLRRRHSKIVSEKEQRIRALEHQLLDGRHQLAIDNALAGPPREFNGAAQSGEAGKHARALFSARERARQSDIRNTELCAQVEHLKREVRRLELRIAAPEPGGSECPGAQACELKLPKDERLRVLYLGGRSGSVDQLRSIAEQASADFFHHDGGQQESFHKIGPMIEKCHIVFCPVDCVSHRACLLAKDECKRLSKGFVPLLSAGQTTFKRALSEIRG